MSLDEASVFFVEHCDRCSDQTPGSSPLQSDLLDLHRAGHEMLSGLVAPFTWVASAILDRLAKDGDR